MKILHIDDHQLFTEGLAIALTSSQLECDIHSALNTREAFKLLEKHHDFDLVLLDLSMPELEGIHFIQGLLERSAMLPIAILSANEDARKIKQALDLGAIAFLPKSWGTEQLVDSLKLIEQGNIIIPEEIRQSIERLPQKRANIFENNTYYNISKRQKDVLLLIQQGLSNRAIAEVLSISETTVKSHVQSLFQIFNAKNRMDCVLKATELGQL